MHPVSVDRWDQGEGSVEWVGKSVGTEEVETVTKENSFKKLHKGSRERTQKWEDD